MAKRRRVAETSEEIDKEIKFPKILDGTFYQVQNHNKATKSVTAKCMICKIAVKGVTNSTGNFYSHFYRKHAEQDIESLKNHCEEDEKMKSATSNKIQTLLPFASTLDPKKVGHLFEEIIFDMKNSPEFFP